MEYCGTHGKDGKLKSGKMEHFGKNVNWKIEEWKQLETLETNHMVYWIKKLIKKHVFLTTCLIECTCLISGTCLVKKYLSSKKSQVFFCLVENICPAE